MLFAGERDGSGIRRQLAIDQVEARGFAGAIGSDQRNQFAFRDGKSHAIDGPHAVEGLGDAGNPEQRGA